MCGIIGYLGYRNAYQFLIEGLKKLEYRGYDSVGICIQYKGICNIIKTKGKVSDLEKKIKNIDFIPNIGIGHTRWATHGEPNNINAHPHSSNSGNLIIIHNGIIENYNSLKTMLLDQNIKFNSETDSEVLINLIEYYKYIKKISLSEAVRIALNKIIGAYSIIVMENNNINEIIVAKFASPIVIGFGNKEFFVASDVSPFLKYTKEVLYLEDGEMAIINRKKKIDIRKIINNIKINPAIKQLHFKIDNLEKGNYKHFMIKEIYEQPNFILNIIRKRLFLDKSIIKIKGLSKYKINFIKTNKIIIIACGTSWHAGLIAEYLFEDITRLPVEVEYASEFRYRNPVINSNDIILAISQSGETADTIAAIKIAKKKGAFVFSICNVVGSSISRITDTGVYTDAGPEIGVASTKSFTTQVTILILMSLKIGIYRNVLKKDRYYSLCKEIDNVYNKIIDTLKVDNIVKNIAYIYCNSRNFLYLGRGLGFPIALEGALKLKEISYIHAEGYPAAEMKHGPIALIDKNMPVVIIATKKGNYEKIINNIQEIKARKGKIIAIVNKGDTQVKFLADHIIEVPEISEELSPLINIIPLQFLAYYIALIRGENVDQPRNLAKSVTVE